MPLLHQAMVGVGLPVAVQLRVTCCPDMALTNEGERTAVGGTAEYEGKYTYINIKKMNACMNVIPYSELMWLCAKHFINQKKN